MLKFNSIDLVGRFTENPVPETDDVLADMIRVKTLVEGPANKQQALKIIGFFGLPDTISHSGHPMETFWDTIYQIKYQLFNQLHQAGIREWRVDWSRRDGAFCLWYRHNKKELDATRDILFVKETTLDNMENTEIKESPIHGFGLFSSGVFSSGDLLTKLDGQLMTKREYERQKTIFNMKLGNLINHFFMEWNVVGRSGLLLVRPMRTKYSYINHDPNYNVILEPDGNMIRLSATRDIVRGEEILLDYRKESLPKSYFHVKNASYLINVDIEPF